MSSEAATTRGGLDLAFEGQRRAILRLAFGVTACFALVEALDWDATFLAPLLASNFLAKLPRQPTLAQGLGVILVIALAPVAVLVLTNLLLSNAAVLILALTLLNYLAFYAHRRGAPGLVTYFIQLSALALPTIAVLSPAGAGGFASTLSLAGAVAMITVWVAYAAFPPPAATSTGAAPAASPPPPAEPAAAARHALLDTLVLLPILTWFVLDATQLAIVVLTTMLKELREQGVRDGQETAIHRIVGNLIGGLAATLAYNLLLLNNTLIFFIPVCLTVSLLFADRIVMTGDRNAAYAVGFTTFILLVGHGMSPLPGSSGETFVNRLHYVLLASAYTIGCLSILHRWRPDRSAS